MDKIFESLETEEFLEGIPTDMIPTNLEAAPSEDLLNLADSLQRAIEARQMFSSPGGKSFLAKTIVSYLPEHQTYVEPFIGGAAVFFEKKPSDLEVINDRNPEISHAYKFIRDMSARDFAALKQYDFYGTRSNFERALAENPQSGARRFWKHMILTRGSFASKKTSFASNGRLLMQLHFLERFKKRLKGVTVRTGSYQTLLEQFNSKNTLFYLDPPYPKSMELKEIGTMTNEEMSGQLKKIRGKFILSYPYKEAVQLGSGYRIKVVMVPRKMENRPGVRTTKISKEAMVFNFRPAKVRVYSQESMSIDPAGGHEHPHPEDGSHSHPGLPDGGGHTHEKGESGSHNHGDGPLEGGHLVSGMGLHEHWLAKGLSDYVQFAVDAHHPAHKWLPGHSKTWIKHVGLDAEFREATGGDWVDHILWETHPSAMPDPGAHNRIFLDPETRIIEKEYEFQDGSRRPANKEDFLKEVQWFAQNTPPELISRLQEAKVAMSLGEAVEVQLPSKTEQPAKLDPKLTEILQNLPMQESARRPLMAIVGGSAAIGEGKDLLIWVNWSEHDTEFLAPITASIKKMFPPDWNVEFITENRAAFDLFVPIADVVVGFRSDIEQELLRGSGAGLSEKIAEVETAYTLRRFFVKPEGKKEKAFYGLMFRKGVKTHMIRFADGADPFSVVNANKTIAVVRLDLEKDASPPGKSGPGAWLNDRNPCPLPAGHPLNLSKTEKGSSEEKSYGTLEIFADTPFSMIFRLSGKLKGTFRVARARRQNEVWRFGTSRPAK